jgi:hypothetical protein
MRCKRRAGASLLLLVVLGIPLMRPLTATDADQQQEGSSGRGRLHRRPGERADPPLSMIPAILERHLNLSADQLNPVLLPSHAYPIERGLCGHWVHAYARLHADILAGRWAAPSVLPAGRRRRAAWHRSSGGSRRCLRRASWPVGRLPELLLRPGHVSCRLPGLSGRSSSSSSSSSTCSSSQAAEAARSQRACRGAGVHRALP